MCCSEIRSNTYPRSQKYCKRHECLILMIIPHVWVSQSKYNTTRSQRGPIYQLSMGQNRTEMIGRAWVKCNKFLLYFTSYVIYLSIVKLQTFLWFHKLFIYGFLFTYFPHTYSSFAPTLFGYPKRKWFVKMIIFLLKIISDVMPFHFHQHLFIVRTRATKSNSYSLETIQILC